MQLPSDNIVLVVRLIEDTVSYKTCVFSSSTPLESRNNDLRTVLSRHRGRPAFDMDPFQFVASPVSADRYIIPITRWPNKCLTSDCSLVFPKCNPS